MSADEPWQEVVSSTSSTHSTKDVIRDAEEDAIASALREGDATTTAEGDKAESLEIIVSDANVEGGGMWLTARAGLMLFFVVAIWLFGVVSPPVAIALIWHGGSYAYTALAGLVAVTVYPYLAAGGAFNGTGEKYKTRGSVDQGGSWLAFRHIIPEWGQYWHQSCARVYENEGPDSWDTMPPTIVCYHPHGVFTQGYILNGSLNRELPRIVGLLATSLYHAPVFRLVFGRWAGASAPASREKFLEQMNQGNSFGIIPGGFQEAAIAKLGVDRIWLKERKGFIKYALRYGYRLRPVFTFGESSTYWNVQGWWKIRLWLTERNVSAVFPWGVWWCPLLPKRVRLTSVFGTPIELPKIDKPSRSDIDRWHSVYIEELTSLYERHKGQYASNPIGKLEIW